MREKISPVAHYSETFEKCSYFGPILNGKVLYINMVRTFSRVLNESNSHCYLRCRKHDPTTDTNTFNATALLLSR